MPMKFMSNRPKYPIYIISKGRWSRRQTVKLMQLLQVPFHVVVEPSEYNEYAAVIPKENILSLPFADLGQGSIPARNWVWQHSKSLGYQRHWILDDNIDSIYRLNNNKKLVCTTPAPFRAAEDFVDRYENVAIAGFNYNAFVQKNSCMTPYRLNTRIYSCILLSNEIDYEWRGRYNEDTDLSLRVLKDGWCTVLFNAFVCNKETTMSDGYDYTEKDVTSAYFQGETRGYCNGETCGYDRG